MTSTPRPRPEARREPASGEWVGVLALTDVDLLTESVRTERLLLRPFRAEDVDAVHRASQDPEAQRWQKDLRAPQPSQARPGSLHEGLRDRIDRLGLSVVVEDADGFAGTAGLYLRAGRLGPEIGYTTASWARGRGYATETARALADWGLAHGASRVHLYVDVQNAPSLAVARRAGFTQEGVVRGCLERRDGTRADAALFGAAPSLPGGQAVETACCSAVRACAGPVPFCGTSVSRISP